MSMTRHKALASVLTVLSLAIIIVAETETASAEIRLGPPFRVEQHEGSWWMVAPDGKRFFSRGVSVVNTGLSWLEFKPENPGYAAWQHYKRPLQWADATLERLKSWGFTTIGGWSDPATLKLSAKMDMPYTVVLHLGASGVPWFDMWDPAVIHDVERIAREQIEKVKKDPLLIGYYTDNELGWWNAALFKMVLEHPPTSQTRQRLIKVFREQYKNEWTSLTKDFEPVGVSDFAGLEKGGLLFLHPGGEGMETIKRFMSMVAHRYYELCHNVIRKYDPRGLILADRYQSFYYPEVAREAKPYVDAISINWNPEWNDGTSTRFFFETLHALTEKPILITEYYACAMENHSGNQNSSDGFLVVQTQEERAESFRNSTVAMASFPFVIGADWFQYYDEPKYGRDDGENYNMGLVDIYDEPYEEITAAARKLDLNALHANPPSGTDASMGVPRAPKDPMAGKDIRQLMEYWDRRRGLVKCASPFPVADLYACWDEDALYLGVYCMDSVEPGFYKDNKIPEVDRIEWNLKLGPDDKQKAIRIRMGAGGEPSVYGAQVEIKHAAGIRNVALVRLPAELIGKPKLQPESILPVVSTIRTFTRAHSMEWKADLKLGK